MRRSSNQRIRARLSAACESMERRTLLCYQHMDPSAWKAPEWSDAIEQESRDKRIAEGGPEAIDIVWTNEFISSGDGDNMFDEVFGTSAAAARGVVNAAISAWEQVITSFNRGDGTNTLQISITMVPGSGGFGGAGGPAATAPADGKPRTGGITINAGNITPNPNDNNGWFLDSSPADYSEFLGTILTPFAGTPATNVGGELFSVVSAEITHCLGLISPKAGGGGANFNGYLLVNSGLVQPTGLRDNAEGGGTSGYFYTFNGFSVSHLMTSFNSGDADDDSWGNVIHTAGETGFLPSWAGQSWNGTEDDGNAAGSGARTIPSWVTAHILADAYGYSIENPAKFGTMLAVLNQNTGRLTIRGLDNSNDFIFVGSGGGKITVSVDLGTDIPGTGFRAGAGNLGAWVSEFNQAAVSQIVINGGSGNDTVSIDQTGGTVPVTVWGDAGTDELVISGSTGYDNFNADFPFINSSNTYIESYGEFEQLRFITRTGNADVFMPDLSSSIAGVTVQGDSGNETINLHTLEAGKPMVFFMSSGHDTVNIQTDGGSSLINSAITVNGGDGNDTVNVAPVDFAGGILSQPVRFEGDNDNDAMVLGSNNADSIAASMTFVGGSGTDDRIIYNDQAPSYNIGYDVQPTLVRRTGLSVRDVNYTSTDRIVINCGNGADSVIVRNAVTPTIEAFGNEGSDNFTRGDGIVTASSVANFNGGNGIDQITFDDHLSAGNIIWDCRQNEVFYGGLITQFTTGFESVGILAGTGNNEITFAGTLSQNFNVDAGDGVDTIILGFLTTATIQGQVSVNGGDGSDIFQINGVNTSGGGSVALNGGNSLNSMTVNRPGTIYYDVGSSFLNMYSFANQAQIGLANIESGTITGSSLNEAFNLYSASSLFGQFQINASGGDDIFNCLPNDNGNWSFSNLVLTGGSGTNTFVYYGPNGGVGGVGGVYYFENGYLAIPRGFLVDYIQISSGIQNITLQGGNGSDTVFVNQFSTGANLRINGGDGDDALSIGNGNMAANLTNAASFNYDGQGGSNTFNINNTANANSWTYTIGASSVVCATSFPAPAYSWNSGTSNVQTVNINAGAQPDGFVIQGVPTGQTANLYGGNGADTLTWATNPANIQGVINFYGQGGNFAPGDNKITNISNPSSAGQTVHVLNNSIGAFPGDTYWGPGGALYFYDVGEILLTMGSGADAVYAEPNTTADITVRGSNGSDLLLLALADAVNYSINPTSVGEGTVTSDNLHPLTYQTFDADPVVDDAAPSAIGSDFAVDLPAMALSFTFDEDVSPLLGVNWLELTNLTTSEVIPTANIQLDYDFGLFVANFTFPGYEAGILPDGDYHARIPAGLADVYGNAMSADTEFDFFFLNGDATRDRSVNSADFNVLATNFGTIGRLFTEGDFTYDGDVNSADFNILATKFGTSLPGSGESARGSTSPAGGAGGAQAGVAFGGRRIGDGTGDDDDAVALL